ncbi:MAG: hypothetical protein A4E67_00002 [Syntrophaceae bacterium PtaB.Bin038]|nr:MAG: hypothetical protein A4E67_00002 [Syntrophaceae bacterium PtaB.Bin038]
MIQPKVPDKIWASISFSMSVPTRSGIEISWRNSKPSASTRKTEQASVLTSSWNLAMPDWRISGMSCDRIMSERKSESRSSLSWIATRARFCSSRYWILFCIVRGSPLSTARFMGSCMFPACRYISRISVFSP